MPVRAACPNVVGRDEEVRHLLSFAGSLREGMPQVALVSGSAGMGKTRLISEVAARLSTVDVRLLPGGCVPLGGGGPPYTGLTSALRSALPPTAPIFDALTGRAAVTRSQLFELLRQTIGRQATQTPTVLVVEDLQWADRSTLEALLYLVSHAVEGRWGLIGTFRYEGPMTRAELATFIDKLERRPILHLALAPLSVQEVALQMEGINGHPPTEDVALNVHQRSGGIPLLVEEVVAAGESGTPDHLRSLFLTRVSSLGTKVKDAMSVVAIVRDGCDETLVAAVLGWDSETVRSALRRATQADLVVADSSGYRVRHELLREVVCDDLAPGRRRELHGRVARCLAAKRGVEAAVLAHHWYYAGRPDEAARASLTAAAEAERVHSPASTHEHLERVLELWPSLGDDVRAAAVGRSEVLRRAAAAAESVGAVDRAVVLTEDRIDLGIESMSDLALQWERLARYRWQAGDGFGAQAAYEHAVDLLPPDAVPDVRAKVLSGYAWFLGATFDLDRAKALSDEARRASTAGINASVRWQVLLSWGVARLSDEDGYQALVQARDVAAALDAGPNAALSLMWLNNSLQQRGWTGEREAILNDALTYVATHGLGASVENAVHFMLAELMIEIGRWDEADEILDINRSRGVKGMTGFFTYSLAARLAAHRGDEDRLDEAVRLTANQAAAIPHQPIPHCIALLAQAENLMWKGRASDALPVAHEALALAAVDPFYRADALAVCARAEADSAEWMRRHGRTTSHESHDLFVDRARAVDGGTSDGKVHALVRTAIAEADRIVGRRDATPWLAAVEAWLAADDPYHLAYSRWRLAFALLGSRSGRGQATRQLQLAWEAAEELRAKPLRSAIEALSVAAKLHIGPELQSGGGARVALELGLTSRELEILPLLACGRTNAEIAEMMVISPRTVGVHVSRILQKLGATRRTEAADTARRAGLIDG